MAKDLGAPRLLAAGDGFDCHRCGLFMYAGAGLPMVRKAVPDRRLCETVKVNWGNFSFFVTKGIDHETMELVEVFYGDGFKTGEDLRNVVHDACVLISLLLQNGVGVAEFAKSLSATENPMNGDLDPGSIIGRIVEELLRDGAEKDGAG